MSGTPTWPTVINALGSTSSEFGAADWANLISQYYNGVNIALTDAGKAPLIGTLTRYRFEKLALYDSDESHYVSFSVDDIDTGSNRKVKFRRMNTPFEEDYAVLEGMPQSILNKTIDSDLNTITNIVNADIKTAAGIVYSKLNLTNSLIANDLTSDAIITSKILDANVTLAKLASNSVNSSKIVDDSIVNIDVNASAAIAYSKLNLATSILNADINASAGIITTKLADSNNFVLTTRTNSFGDFNQVFKDNKLLINNPADTFSYTIIAAAIAANRNVTLPLLTGNDIFVTEAFNQTLTNKTISISNNTLTGVAPSDAQYVTLTTNATLTNERTLVGSTGIIITDGGAGNSVTLEYNPIERAKKWIIMESDMFLADSKWPFGTQASGAGSNVDTTSNTVAGHPGVWELETGTTTTGRAGLGSYDTGTGSININEGEITYVLIAKLSDLSVLADRYTVIFGLAAYVHPTAASFDHGTFFRYKDDVNTGKYEAVCRADDVETAVDTGITADTNWHVFKVIINAAGTSVAFYIDGTQVSNSPVTTNIPTGASRAIYPSAEIEKTLGTTNRLVFLDYMGLFQKLTTGRFT